jgi:hypothetical protein
VFGGVCTLLDSSNLGALNVRVKLNQDVVDANSKIMQRPSSNIFCLSVFFSTKGIINLKNRDECFQSERWLAVVLKFVQDVPIELKIDEQ